MSNKNEDAQAPKGHVYDSPVAKMQQTILTLKEDRNVKQDLSYLISDLNLNTMCKFDPNLVDDESALF